MYDFFLQEDLEQTIQYQAKYLTRTSTVTSNHFLDFTPIRKPVAKLGTIATLTDVKLLFYVPMEPNSVNWSSFATGGSTLDAI